MKDILVRLYMIFGIAKDLHYSSSGSNFYGLHLMYDRIADGLIDAADRIQESYFLARNLPAIPASEIFLQAASHPDSTGSVLRETITSTIYTIDEMSKSPELSEGDKSMIGDISAELAQKLAFLNRYLEEGRL